MYVSSWVIIFCQENRYFDIDKFRRMQKQVWSLWNKAKTRKIDFLSDDNAISRQ